MDKLGVINGLRGFAVLAVIYHHLFSPITKPGFKSITVGKITLLPYTLLANGWLGVNLFFILSGFVLAYPYFLGKRNLRTGTDIRQFYLRRAKRLLPLYYFCVVFCIIFIAQPTSTYSVSKQAIILGGILFNFTSGMWFPPPNWVLWSLGIEIWFSIAFPMIILAIARFGILRVLIAVLFLSLITRIFGNASVFNIGNFYLNPVKDSLLGRLDEFLLGMFVCHLYVKWTEYRLNFNPLLHFALGLILILVASTTWDYVFLGQLPQFLIPFINNVLNFGFCALLLSLLLMQENWIKHIFDNYFIQLIGVMCYSLYIWHGVVMVKILGVYNFVNVVAYLGLLFLLAALSYRYIEFGHSTDTLGLFLLGPPRPPSSAPFIKSSPASKYVPLRRNKLDQITEPVRTSCGGENP